MMMIIAQCCWAICHLRTIVCNGRGGQIHRLLLVTSGKLSLVFWLATVGTSAVADWRWCLLRWAVSWLDSNSVVGQFVLTVRLASLALDCTPGNDCICMYSNCRAWWQHFQGLHLYVFKSPSMVTALYFPWYGVASCSRYLPCLLFLIFPPVCLSKVPTGFKSLEEPEASAPTSVP